NTNEGIPEPNVLMTAISVSLHANIGQENISILMKNISKRSNLASM
ncbi:26795_t:CDS:1, partial [Racocetra persica]